MKKQEILKLIESTGLNPSQNLVLIDRNNGKIYTGTSTQNMTEVLESLYCNLSDLSETDKKSLNDILITEKPFKFYNILGDLEYDWWTSRVNAQISIVLVIDYLDKTIVLCKSDQVETKGMIYIEPSDLFTLLNLNEEIIDFTGTSKETVTWFIDFMIKLQGYSLVPSKNLFGSKVIIDSIKKTIEPYDPEMSEYKRLLMPSRLFKDAFSVIFP